MKMRSGLMRVLPALLLAAATTIGGAGSAGARSAVGRQAAAHSLPPAVLSVSPNTGLVDNQSVTLGPAGSADAYLICPTALVASPDQCSYLTDVVSAGSSATVKIPARVVVVAIDGTASFVDCRTASCSAVAVSYQLGVDGPVVVASAALAFNPAGALRTPPSLTVAPSTGLVDGQQVAVTVTPAVIDDAFGGTVVIQCAAPLVTLDDLSTGSSDCSFDSLTPVDGPDGGTGTATVSVRTFIETTSGPVDCRAVTSTCVLFTYDPVFQTSNVPLTFDPNGAVAPAFLTRPSADPFDPVASGTFDLVGFTPGDPFEVHFCNAAGACLPTVVTSGTLDADGVATFSLDAPYPEDAPADFCAEWCAMQATDAHGLSATSDYRFSVFVPVPPGPFRSKQLPVRVTPNKGLHDGDTVTVTASGFAPGATLSIVECDGSAVKVGDDACDLGTSSFINGTDLTADAHGNLTATYAIKRHITTPKNGPLDCATSNVDPDAYNAGVAADPSRAGITAPGYFSCIIVVADIGDYQQSGGTPFAFEGAKFRRLPWQVDARQAPAATPVAAQPTFTG